MCGVYSALRIVDVDADLFQLFINIYTVSDADEAFNSKCVRNFDASNIPSCKG